MESTSNARSSQSRTPIWLDCDTGHDDAFAILLAAKSPDVLLLGISTVSGNAPLENTTYNTRAILKAIGRDDVPIYPGASRPSWRDPAHAPDIHGASGLDGTQCLPEPTTPARMSSAVEEMYQSLIAEPAGTAWLVAVGAMTNIAELFRRHPGLVDHIAGLSVMGGAVGGGFTDAPMSTVEGEGERFGNHTPYAEFNIYCDPEAAQVVFSLPGLAAKTTLIPLDLTHQFLATSKVQMGLLFGCMQSGLTEVTMAGVTPVRRLFFEILTFFAKTYADVFGLKAGPPTHDPLAVAAAFKPELFVCMQPASTGDESERFSVDVVTEGEHGAADEIRSGPSQCGRTVVQPLPPGRPGVTIPRALDATTLWSLIEACLSRAEYAMQEQPPANGIEQRGPKRPQLSPAAAAEQREAKETENPDASFVSLIRGSETTLSQMEVAAGLPDVRLFADDDAIGEHLSTNKVSNLHEEPLNVPRIGANEGGQQPGYS